MVNMLNYISSSNKDKYPIIFIHGIAGSANSFKQQIKSLGKDYYVISIDLPGYGKSKLDSNFTIEKYAKIISDFIIHKKLKSPILVGHSLGGMIVQKIVISSKDFIKACILVGTTSKFGSKNPNWEKKFIHSRIKPLEDGKTMKEISFTSIRNIVSNKKIINKAVNIMSEIPEETYKIAIRSLIGFDINNKLNRINIPTLLIAGEQDILAPPKTMKKMQEKIKNSKLITIKNCGHLINLEKPRLFNKIIKNYVINF